MNTIDKKLNNILIVSITPYFLEKEVLWFTEHLQDILQGAKTQSFFQDNIAFLEKGQHRNISELLRKLDDMGYEKVFTVSDPGEFSQQGGIIEKEAGIAISNIAIFNPKSSKADKVGIRVETDGTKVRIFKSDESVIG